MNPVVAIELSIIIPVLNETQHLIPLLSQLEQQKGIKFEIWVSDGGSIDGSSLQAKQFSSVHVITAERGRGKQMNLAAFQAAGTYLLFLHADSQITHEFFLFEALEFYKRKRKELQQDNVAGHFSLQFYDEGTLPLWPYCYMEAKSFLNRINTTNGDQGFLLSQSFFKQLGGFSTQLPFLEDQYLAEKIRNEGIWITLPGNLRTSARRFQTEGPFRRSLLMALMMGLYWTGVDCFFTRAPQVYREQKQAKRLKLWPFFKIIWLLQIKDLKWKGSFIAWLKVGSYVRGNTWQLFYMMDVRKKIIRKKNQLNQTHKENSCLIFYDRFVDPIWNNIVGNYLVTGIAFLIVMGVLTPFFYIYDKINKDL